MGGAVSRVEKGRVEASGGRYMARGVLDSGYMGDMRRVARGQQKFAYEV